MKKLSILGIRGIPAEHGGFETFAEAFAVYLVEQGWAVTVYCQKQGKPQIIERNWRGINLVDIYLEKNGPLSTFVFDYKCVVHAARAGELILTLGYNTAIFSAWLRFKGAINIMNMDGIEWRRDKWNIGFKMWLYMNEKIGSWLANHLVADHPEIKKHLLRNVGPEKITVIPYGATDIRDANSKLIQEYNLSPQGYGIIIARPEPENSLLEIVTAFSSQSRKMNLVVLGAYEETNEYHRKVVEAASQEVIFLGAIYDNEIVEALRFYAAFYVHGHQVGGTNPSLVEAMGAGNAVIAHDNVFNRWVAGSNQYYFSNVESCAALFDELALNSTKLTIAGEASRLRFHENFTWRHVLRQYQDLVERFVGH